MIYILGFHDIQDSVIGIFVSTDTIAEVDIVLNLVDGCEVVMTDKTGLVKVGETYSLPEEAGKAIHELLKIKGK